MLRENGVKYLGVAYYNDEERPEVETDEAHEVVALHHPLGWEEAKGDALREVRNQRMRLHIVDDALRHTTQHNVLLIQCAKSFGPRSRAVFAKLI